MGFSGERKVFFAWPGISLRALLRKEEMRRGKNIWWFVYKEYYGSVERKSEISIPKAS